MDLVNNTALDIQLRITALKVYAANFGNKHQLLASTSFNPHSNLKKTALQLFEKVDPIGYSNIRPRIQN
jgi:hypothetical protein